jgi:predicted Ser/Thr protein kinase
MLRAIRDSCQVRAGEHPPAGMRVADRYTIVEPIGTGAMGIVYRATDDAGGEVALKRLADHTQAARFEIEARLLARLDHPRLVRVRGPVLDRNDRWIAMDLVPGRDLTHESRDRGTPGLPEDEALGWAREACEALDYIHAQQVVHRDVKPSNLILSPRGIVLVDFGIARMMGGDGTQIGTPLYIAPEVAAGHRATPRSDVYGLAATVLALLTGRPPEPEHAPGYLSSALAIDPAHRPESAAAFAATLGAPLRPATDELLVGDADELLRAVVRATAAAFDAAAVSITSGLTYRVAWGAGAQEIVGITLAPGTGIAGAVLAGGSAEAISDCRADPRFATAVAEATGYVPHTMLVLPIRGGVLSILDRRDGRPYTASDLPRAAHFAELAAVASEHVPQHPPAA